MDLNVFKDAKIAAGKSGMTNEIKSVSVLEAFELSDLDVLNCQKTEIHQQCDQGLKLWHFVEKHIHQTISEYHDKKAQHHHNQHQCRIKAGNRSYP